MIFALLLAVVHSNPFIASGQPRDQVLMPPGWQTPYAPNPFTKMICPADPCTPPNIDPNSSSQIASVMTLSGGFSLGQLNVREPGTTGTGTAHQPVYFASKRDPLWLITCSGPVGECDGLPVSIHIPNGAVASNASDHRFQVIEVDNGNIEYACEQFNDNGTGTGTTAPLYNGGTVSTGGCGQATSLTMYSDGVTGCTTCKGTSAGVPIQPALLDGVELTKGHITHTLSLALHAPSSAFFWPATASDGPNPSGPGEGEYIWLNKSDAQIRALGYPAWETTLLVNMHEYGWIIIATGGTPGPWGIYAVDDQSQMIWGNAGNWAYFFTWLATACPSCSPNFGGDNASHMILNTAGLLQSDLEVVE